MPPDWRFCKISESVTLASGDRWSLEQRDCDAEYACVWLCNHSAVFWQAVLTENSFFILKTDYFYHT